MLCQWIINSPFENSWDYEGQQPTRSVIPLVTVLRQDVQTAWNNTSQDDSILYACVNSVVCFLDEIDQEEYTDQGEGPDYCC